MNNLDNQQQDQEEATATTESTKPDKTITKSNSVFRLQLANQDLYVPINHWTFLIVLVFLLAWVGLDISSKTPGSLTHSVVFGLFKLDTETKDVNSSDVQGSIYEFWTPSVDTPQSFQPQQTWEKMDKKRKRWYTLDEGKETLVKFGQNLLDLGATGYTYVQSYGRGTSALKSGLIWEVTFPRSSPMTPAAFIRLYNRFFHRDKNIYLKISGADATRASKGVKGTVILTHRALDGAQSQ